MLILKLISAAVAASLALAGAASAGEPVSNGYADANGLKMYYETYGEGDPVVVLHGAYMSTGMMGELVEGLAESRRVIVADMQGHGRTADIDRPITYKAMADDVAALMDEINIERADVFGYSMGGGIAYQLAIRHPERVRRLAAASATYKSTGVYPELLAMFETMSAEFFAGSPWEANYREIAPNPDGFSVLVEKLVALDTKVQDWPAGDMKAIAAPTLVISGDADVVLPEHAVEIYRLRGGGGVAPDFMTAPAAELAIIPGATHLGVMERTDLLVPMVASFFDKKIPQSTAGGAAPATE